MLNVRLDRILTNRVVLTRDGEAVAGVFDFYANLKWFTVPF